MSMQPIINVTIPEAAVIRMMSEAASTGTVNFIHLGAKLGLVWLCEAGRARNDSSQGACDIAVDAGFIHILEYARDNGF
jgi:hypothetical protein